jgi:hypothetical protein
VQRQTGEDDAKLQDFAQYAEPKPKRSGNAKVLFTMQQAPSPQNKANFTSTE